MLDMRVFDDPAVGLKAEPFVGAVNTMIDRATATLPNAPHGFIMVFSASAFPDHQFRLEWRRGDLSGNIYHSSEFDTEGWLCPALLRYFGEPPAEIFVQVRARPDAAR